MRHARLAASAVLLTAAVLGATPALAAPEPGAAGAATTYTVVDLGVLPGDELSIPFGLNNNGDVVGYSGALNQVPTPFLWTDATGLDPLALPAGSTSAQAQAINDAGQVAGHAFYPGAVNKAVRWSPAGAPQLLGTLGGSSSLGFGINSRGDVAGWSEVSPPVFEGQEAFLYTDATGVVSVSPGSRPAFGRDVNDSRRVTGEDEFDATIWFNGRARDISGTVAGNTEGEAINNANQVAITRTLPDQNTAYRWTPGVGIESMGLANTDEPTTARGINQAGDVVGRGRISGGDGSMGGYLFTDATGPIDLSQVLAPGSTSWGISEGWDINDVGQIVASATNLATFERHAVRLDPFVAGPCVTNCLRVSAITLTARDIGIDSVRVTGKVTVRDEDRAPVPDALVEVTWDTPFGPSTTAARTDGNGVARFQIDGADGQYTLTVTGVGKNFYAFDPANSRVLSRTIAAP